MGQQEIVLAHYIQTVSFVLCEKAIILLYQSQPASSVHFLVMLIIWGKIAWWFLIPWTNLLPFIYAKKVVQHDVAIIPVDMILFFPLPVRCSVRQRAAYFSHAAIYFAINLEWPENSGTDTVEVCKYNITWSKLLRSKSTHPATISNRGLSTKMWTTIRVVECILQGNNKIQVWNSWRWWCCVSHDPW